jgi:ATPase subunit of ABC transporter with duplicated ATPase domains
VVYLPPHLLVLDEVTTHLDSDTVLALIDALKQYRGALMVITHDRFVDSQSLYTRLMRYQVLYAVCR